MPFWVFCNSCFLSPGRDRKLAVTTCGHVICSVCYQKGSRGKCFICNNQCQVSPLSDTSSSDVKALFSDIQSVATKHLAEISKVITFQARHQKRLLSYYQQKNDKLEDVLMKMKQEMQQMKRKLNEQRAYITQLENTLQHQSVKTSAQIGHTPHGHKTVLPIPFTSPLTVSRHPPVSNISETTEMDERSLFRKPVSAPRLSITRPPQDGRMGGISGRSPNQNMPAIISASSAPVSRFSATPRTPEFSFKPGAAWSSPFFKPSHPHSMSSLTSL